jgi:hypothetical protein
MAGFAVSALTARLSVGPAKLTACPPKHYLDSPNFYRLARLLFIAQTNSYTLFYSKPPYNSGVFVPWSRLPSRFPFQKKLDLWRAIITPLRKKTPTVTQKAITRRFRAFQTPTLIHSTPRLPRIRRLETTVEAGHRPSDSHPQKLAMLLQQEVEMHQGILIVRPPHPSCNRLPCLNNRKKTPLDLAKL